MTPAAPPLLLDDPVEPRQAAAWRAAVLDLRYGERRRVFPTVVHVGHPGNTAATFGLPDHRRSSGSGLLDPALRTDVVAALLDHFVGRRAGGTVPAVWLTRSGPFADHDLDRVWLGSARAAYDQTGLEPTYAVVTHLGWYDPATGVGRRWKRLRHRGAG